METILPDPKFIEIISEYKQRRNNEKIIMVNNGGVLYGAYPMGWGYRIAELGLLSLVSCIIGTSVGGLNGCLFSKYHDDMDKALKVWLSITKKEDVYDRDINIPTISWQFATGSESILDPRGLRSILDKEFGNMIFNDLPIPVITTATDLGNSECDGGWGDNCPVDLAIEMGATKIILLGTSPNVPKDRLKYYSENANIKSSLLKTSAMPIGFPTYPKKDKVKMIDVAKALPEATMDVFEEHIWKTKYWYELLSKENPVKYPTIEWIEGFPAEPLGHSAFDCTKTKDDVEKGYNDAVAYLTLDRVKGFLAR